MSQAFAYAVIILLPVSYAEILPTVTDRNVGYDGNPAAGLILFVIWYLAFSFALPKR